MTERFLITKIECKCGANLRVDHWSVKEGPALQETATCPKCGERHEIPTKILRLFILNDGVWALIQGE